MTASIRVSGTWKNASAIYVKVAGTWKTASSGWVRIAGTWRRWFGSVTRAFTTLSTNYPGGYGAVALGVSGTTLVRWSGESPVTAASYKCDVVTSTTTWTAVTNFPVATQGAYGGMISTTMYGMAGYPNLTGVYGTSNLGSSWTTYASCSSAYWHETTSNGCAQLSGAILKSGGFSSTCESFNGSSWTARTSPSSSQGFGMLVDTPSRTYYTGGPGSESNQANVYSTVGGASWTNETSQPTATRRTYGTNLDSKIVQLGGNAQSSVYIYSGTGGTWSAGIAVGFGDTYTTHTISPTAAYGTGFQNTWKYA
jgi:hypothetical protein